MADSEAFDLVCEKIESNTSLDRLAARGTVRIALKQAGLEARTVTPDQMQVVVERILPGELQSRGIESDEAVCQSITSALSGLTSTGGAETPDAVFRRLGGEA